ncbi:adenylosuccinate synthetase [Sphingobium sp. EM0848]|uniref:adenylosuccinate synthetase n=1 Tax=Sphingobium sp. EM0848 TaxID=2743473 RepID=UPI00159C385E|nr:adenylosuccinate synthetase [Sphingobium sp. EM0848]
MRALAVIGANYGDEGKGRTVDWLAARHGPDAVVVRSNGGAQAGHTVVTETQKRHVFHHIGSGTLHGAQTHLSRFMVSHPILFAEEKAALTGLGVLSAVTADPRGYVTTPWDMMVNQAVEVARGGGRHGSCGLGFGETVGRCEATGFTLTVADLHAGDLAAKLRAIREQWLPQRLAALGLDPAAPSLAFAASGQLMDRFLDQCRAFAHSVEIRHDAGIAGGGTIIFEAAQGLLLDQNAQGFPFLTRSNTGLANMLAIAEEAGIEVIDPIYVTRCYLTRHGRGSMEDERAINRWFAVEDATNRPNPWQESLRFGLIDPVRLCARIAADVVLARGGVMVRPSIAVTCLDQGRGRSAWLDGGDVRIGSVQDLRESFEEKTGLACAATFSSAVNEVCQADQPIIPS